MPTSATSNPVLLTSRQTRRAMGVTCTVTVVGSDAPVLAGRCLELIEELELLWSRFIPSSDICRINEQAGEPAFVDPRTVSMIAHMIAGSDSTRGYFNPTLLPIQLAHGDRASLVDERTSRVPPESVAHRSLAGISILDESHVRLPRGMTLDAGGIGKGFAADLVMERALADGAVAVCVNLGGDMRISGPTPDGRDWTIDILDPVDLGTPISRIVVARGGVATSSMSARHRGSRGIPRHIWDVDGTGESPVVGSTVLASTASWAEIWTKHAMLAPVGTTLQELDRHGLAGLLVTAEGDLIETPTWKDFQP